MSVAMENAALTRQRSARRRQIIAAVEPWLYASPSIVLIAAILLVPLTIGISYAFRDIQLLDPMSGGYVGLAHFRDIWADANFWNALRNTIEWTVVSVLLQFIFGMILALMLNRPFPGRGIVQALVFLPWAVPTFLSGLAWAWLFNPVIGPLPHWMVALGIMTTANSPLADPATALWGPVIANIWYGVPFFAITLLAALKSIPIEFYEAAAVDGATAWQRFTLVTVPFLAPTIAVTVMLRTIWISTFADLIFVMTEGGPAGSTETLATYIYISAFKTLDKGYASAIAVLLLALLLAYALIVLRLRRRFVHEAAR